MNKHEFGVVEYIQTWLNHFDLLHHTFKEHWVYGAEFGVVQCSKPDWTIVWHIQVARSVVECNRSWRWFNPAELSPTTVLWRYKDCRVILHDWFNPTKSYQIFSNSYCFPTWSNRCMTQVARFKCNISLRWFNSTEPLETTVLQREHWP